MKDLTLKIYVHPCYRSIFSSLKDDLETNNRDFIQEVYFFSKFPTLNLKFLKEILIVVFDFVNYFIFKSFCYLCYWSYFLVLKVFLTPPFEKTLEASTFTCIT